MKIIVKTLANLEEVLAEEIAFIGGQNIEIGKRAVSFEGNMRLVYRANYELRTALRVLLPTYGFKVRDEHDLYRKVREIDWSEFLDVNQTFAINATVNHTPKITHSKYAAQKTKDAIVDQFRDRMGRRPNVKLDDPDLRLFLHINQGKTSISVDSSGSALFKRGYRTALEAPINEVLAAGMIMLSGWKGEKLLLDPMCGSGTLLIEAASIAYNIPPQHMRKSFDFMKWPNFEESTWKKVVEQANSNIKTEGPPIIGSDRALKAVKVTQENILTAQMEGKIEVFRKKFERLKPPTEKGLLIMNPPYDIRIGSEDIGALYKMIGDQMKQNYAGYEAWIISSNLSAFKQLGLRPSKKIKLYNGQLECRFQKYELYEGSRKNKEPKEEVS